MTVSCFRTLFPEQSDEALLAATPDTVERWDSTNHFVLLQVVEEEFDVRIPERTGGELLSYKEIRGYLGSRIPAQ